MQSKLHMLKDAHPGSIFSRHGYVGTANEWKLTSTCMLNGNAANVICLLLH